MEELKWQPQGKLSIFNLGAQTKKDVSISLDYGRLFPASVEVTNWNFIRKKNLIFLSQECDDFLVKYTSLVDKTTYINTLP